MDKVIKEKFKQFVREKPSNLIPMLKAEEMEEKIKQLIAELEENAVWYGSQSLMNNHQHYQGRQTEANYVIERLNSILKGG